MADEVITPPAEVDTEALPPELAGKTVKEIAAYYARREQIMQDQMDRMQRTPPPPEKVKEPEVKFDIFNDAEASVNRVVNKTVTEALANASAVIAPGVIGGIKVSMATKFKDWSRFGSEVEKRMGDLSQESQMNPAHWEYTYKIVKGENADNMVKEAVHSARNPVERPTPKGQEPPEPRALNDQERTIAAKFHMTPDKYRSASERYTNEDGALPFTLDSKNPKRKAS